MVIDLFTGHSEWRCVVGNMRETLMPVPCNGLHFTSSMEIEAISMRLSQTRIVDPPSAPPSLVSSSSDEIVPDTSAPIVEENYRERALRIAPILPCR